MYVEFMRICQRHLKITDLNVVNIYEIEPERMVSYKYAYDWRPFFASYLR